ncbi:MAG TPA: serine hydrolase [Candidatus Polarisedimenticolia bacterium]|nr:serine hydrolase [Candidatus Polarisedimenticolia bacterium]
MRRGNRIDDFLADRIAAGDFPGASYLVGERSGVVAEGALGRSAVEPESHDATPQTLYDLASLSKPLATALLASHLQGKGVLRLEDPLSRHLPAWAPADARANVTLLDLLTHRSGLPAWLPFYIHAADRDRRVEWLLRRPLEAEPGRRVVYSDPGYILLGFALEHATGRPLDRLFAERVARPLNLDDATYRPLEPPASIPRARIAAGERGTARERDLAGPEGEGYNGWRTGIIWGTVHDQNAFTLGGVAGHAGLFGTARAVYRLAQECLWPGGRVMPPPAAALFRSSLTPGLEEERSVGFQLASTAGSSAGAALPPTAFGHTGFTGTSVWIDPVAGRIHVLLTNRLHPRFAPLDMNAVRRDFHAIAAAL